MFSTVPDGNTGGPCDGKPIGMSRRGFLRGAGISVAGSALLNSGLIGSARGAVTADAKVAGPGQVPLALRVNGREHRLSVEPRTTLASALRDSLGLTGAKIVCDRGACSACTVFLDGVQACSCMTLAIEVGQREVTTIEGLAQDGKLHPVQEAFVECDASMCGFCTPGMVMSCAALLKRNPKPSSDEIQAAVSGNLCRCGTYPKVFEAAALAAKKGGAA